MSMIKNHYINHMKVKIDNMDLTENVKTAFKTLVSELDSEYAVDMFRIAEHISTNKFIDEAKGDV